MKKLLILLLLLISPTPSPTQPDNDSTKTKELVPPTPENNVTKSKSSKKIASKKKTKKKKKKTNILGQKIYNEKKELLIGASLPLEGGVAQTGMDISMGANLFFNRINQAGGIKKKFTIKFNALNDRYLADKTRKNILGLLPEGVLSVLTYGPDSRLSYRAEINKEEVVAIFPVGGADDLREKASDNVVFFRAPIEKEVEALLNYGKTQMIRTRLAIFYENSQFGKAGLAAAKKIAKKIGVKIVKSAFYQKNTLNIMPAVEEINKKTPDVVLCISQSYPAYNFIQQMLNKGNSSCLFLGLGELAPVQKNINMSRGIKLVISSVVPNPLSKKIEICKEYAKAMKEDLPISQVSQFGMEAYICAKLLVRALEDLPDDATYKDLIKKLQSDTEIGGINLKYNPEHNGLCDSVWLNTGDLDSKMWEECK